VTGLTRERLAARFAATRPPLDPSRGHPPRTREALPPEIAAELAGPHRPAAVLLPLFEREARLHVWFTERATHLRRHAGQVSFPGGRADRNDADVVATALREAEEEIGLPRSHVEVLGFLEPQVTTSGYAVTGVIGFVGRPFEPVLDPGEVAALFDVPLDFLADPANLRRVVRRHRGVTFESREYDYDGRIIWGATALMLERFIELIKDNSL
jgi:8-oxo-dGTP pyrophosphatase MutT (NUDIX family)